MPRHPAALPLVLLALALIFARAGGEERPPPGPARAGMTQDDVLLRHGPPRRVARQILYRRYLEQWIYDGATALRVEFDCPRGKAPVVIAVRPLHADKR